MTVRLAPNHLVRLPHGALLEVISRPYEDDDGHPVVKARDPGDPTTIATYDVGNLEPVEAECQVDRARWDAVVAGEFDLCHVECPRCGRGYHATHDASGKFLEFAADRPLVFLRRDPPGN